MKKQLLFYSILMLNTVTLNAGYFEDSGKGSGTLNDPYRIESRTDLSRISEYLNISDIYFELMNDIDLENVAWTPIKSSTRSFLGTFLGNGKKISNLKIEKSTASLYVGLFETLGNGARIENLHIENGLIEGDGSGSSSFYVGSIAGKITNTSSNSNLKTVITGCTNTSTVKGGPRKWSTIGGLVGECFTSSGQIEISNCINKGTIDNTGSENSHTGGIIGNGFASNGGLINITNCTNTGIITGGINRTYTGGISGAIYILFSLEAIGNFEINSCSNLGLITSSGDATSSTGGIVGDAASTYKININIRNCYNKSILESIQGRVGGIVGASGGYNNNSISIEKCFASGAISKGESISTNAIAAGIVGQAQYAINIINSVSAFDLIEGTINDTHRIINSSDISKLSGNYAYDATLINDATISSADANGVDGLDMTLTDLQQISTYNTLNWSFGNNGWMINDGAGFPFLGSVESPIIVADNDYTKAYDITGLSSGSSNIPDFSSAATIKLQGIWNNDLFEVLKKAIKGQNVAMAENINLNEIDLAEIELDGSLLSGLSALFYNCSGLETVIFPTKSYEGEVDLSSLFHGCSSLKNLLNLRSFIKINNLSGTFYNCFELESVILPGIQETVQANIDFSLAFYGCHSLKEIQNLSVFTKASDFEYAFYNCMNLETIKLPETQEAQAPNISFLRSFYNNRSLKNIENLANFTKVATLNEAFYNCMSLESVTLPLQQEANLSTISFEGAFYNCYSLKNIANLGVFTVNSLSTAFLNCSSLTSVTLGSIPSEEYLSNVFSGTNPNCLKYLPSGTVNIPDNWVTNGYKNFIVDGDSPVTFGDIELTDKKPFKCPKAFDLKTNHQIVYVRDFTGCFANKYNGWNTLLLPFNATLMVNGAEKVPFESETASNGQFWLKKFISATEDGVVTFEHSGAIQANIPYIIALPGASFGSDSMEDNGDIMFRALSLEDSPVTISATPEILESVEGSNDRNFVFKGSFDIMEEQPDLFLLTPSESENGSDSFVKYAKGNLYPFRAYFTPDISGSSGVRMLSFGNKGGVTNLQTGETYQSHQYKIYSEGNAIIVEAFSNGEIDVYSIDGKIIMSEQLREGRNVIKGLTPGIYIANSTKIVITQ